MFGELLLNPVIQGGFFNCPPSPKNHKFYPVSKCFQKKLEYPDWPPPLKSLSVGLAPPKNQKVLSVRIYLLELTLLLQVPATDFDLDTKKLDVSQDKGNKALGVGWVCVRGGGESVSVNVGMMSGPD